MLFGQCCTTVVSAVMAVSIVWSIFLCIGWFFDILIFHEDFESVSTAERLMTYIAYGSMEVFVTCIVMGIINYWYMECRKCCKKTGQPNSNIVVAPSEISTDVVTIPISLPKYVELNEIVAQ